MSIALTATVTGIKQIRNAFAKADKDHRRALGGALFQKGEAIMTDAKKQCPVDKGRLRGSGYVAPPDLNASEPVVELGFGTKYGPYVHERYGDPMTDKQRKYFFWALRQGIIKPGGGKKSGKKHFLKDPLDQHRSGYTRWIQKKTRENLGRGVGLFRSGTYPTRPAEGKRG